MPLDPLEERVLLRGILDILAEGVPEEARESFILRNVDKLNKAAPALGKAQKRRFIRFVE